MYIITTAHGDRVNTPPSQPIPDALAAREVDGLVADVVRRLLGTT